MTAVSLIYPPIRTLLEPHLLKTEMAACRIHIIYWKVLGALIEACCMKAVLLHSAGCKGKAMA